MADLKCAPVAEFTLLWTPYHTRHISLVGFRARQTSQCICTMVWSAGLVDNYSGRWGRTGAATSSRLVCTVQFWAQRAHGSGTQLGRMQSVIVGAAAGWTLNVPVHADGLCPRHTNRTKCLGQAGEDVARARLVSESACGCSFVPNYSWGFHYLSG